jgi:hypothetical protein
MRSPLPCSGRPRDAAAHQPVGPAAVPGVTAPRGAYGLRLPGLPGQQWLNSVPDSWAQWHLRHAAVELVDDAQWVTSEGAQLRVRPEGAVLIDRRARVSTVRMAMPPPVEAYVHPLLGTTAIVAAEWSGRLTFHGGCVLDRRGRAWGLLGEREAGKSTALAWFHLHGRTVLADDIIVTDGVETFVGPRCVDLREGSSQRFGLGRDIGLVGTRRRWRVDLEETAASVPLAGFVVLEWGSEPAVVDVPLSDKAAVLTQHRGMVIGQQHPLPWLELLGAPLLRFRRPRAWQGMDAAMRYLGDRLDELAPTARIG